MNNPYYYPSLLNNSFQYLPSSLPYLFNGNSNNIAFPLDNEQNNINLSKSFNKENNNDFEFKAQPDDSE